MKTPDNGIRGEMPATFMTIREKMASHMTGCIVQGWLADGVPGLADVETDATRLAQAGLVLADTLLAKLSENAS